MPKTKKEEKKGAVDPAKKAEDVEYARAHDDILTSRA